MQELRFRVEKWLEQGHTASRCVYVGLPEGTGAELKRVASDGLLPPKGELRPCGGVRFLPT